MVMAIGFSRNTALPARRQSTAIASWVSSGVMMMTASTSGRVSSLR